MADNILSSLLSAPAISFVNEKLPGVNVWQNLNVVSNEISERSSNTDFPLEKESSLADLKSAKILEPTKVKISALCDDATTLTSILNVLYALDSTMMVKSKGVLVNNLVITELELEYSPEMLNVAKVGIDMEQAFYLSLLTYSPSQGPDFSMITKGLQTLEQVGNTVSNFASGLIGKLGI